MSVSYKHMANCAYRIANDKLEPFHYKSMYTLITGEKPKSNPSTDHCENFRNQIHYNDIRFHHLDNGYFTLKQWVVNNTLLQNYSKIKNEYTIDILSSSLIESGERIKYMLNKYNDDPKTRCNKVLKGKSVEQCTIDCFKKFYGNAVEISDNDYMTPDRYDFKIYGLKIDVKCVGLYNLKKVLWIEKNRISKNMADVFLCVESNGTITLSGYILLTEKFYNYETKKQYIYTINSLHDCQFLIVYINHLKYGYKIKEILENGVKRNV